ncbi:patatin [Caballeronia glebae]|uniref:Patatin n=1 Tax=Caballeronia glebae TaxID=1777143 RepID=A0A158B382_9BURK|nr:patatin-like phospholipase family protein [Caballeronia glebae]SAK64390.1 patatin [Caballeronia glebae]
MRRSQRNTHTQTNPIALPDYDEVCLVLQGGGALGSYQAGVVEGLTEAGVDPTWTAGVSIGALNTAIIAGNAPENRVAALRGFWSTICQPADLIGQAGAFIPAAFGFGNIARKFSSDWAAAHAVMEGQRGFFSPRAQWPFALAKSKQPSDVSFYYTSALRSTLLQFADFDRINDGAMRVSVGAVNVGTGNLVYFDNREMRLAPEHFMASGALPPGFPAVEVDGEFYWDGGLVSNTPLAEIIGGSQHKDVLVFQVDVWTARGTLPADLLDVSDRTKDIQYSSRTRAITDFVLHNQKNARLIKELLEHIPEETRCSNPLLREAQSVANGGALNVVHLIYKDKFFEGHYKDFEFSNDTMGEHWASGLEDIRRSFAHPEWFEVPNRDLGFVTHDVHRHEPAPQATAEMPKPAAKKLDDVVEGV